VRPRGRTLLGTASTTRKGWIASSFDALQRGHFGIRSHDPQEVRAIQRRLPTIASPIAERRASRARLVVPAWGCSSAGRAAALQAVGRGFESLHLHCEPCQIFGTRERCIERCDGVPIAPEGPRASHRSLLTREPRGAPTRSPISGTRQPQTITLDHPRGAGPDQGTSCRRPPVFWPRSERCRAVDAPL
jgi:hypothetical protein